MTDLAAARDVPEESVRAAFELALRDAGGVRALARLTRLTPTYISRVRSGHERIDGDLARYLGFERVTVYRRIEEPTR